ncbi:DegT/DnrJ/EryC1/StrS family aminotransferase [Flavobacteriaceae bacterium]|nr:DegT/DnrJ/EryC1/StrS family aminotransferase [Flavobacteriaceae bacterium]
MSEAVQDKIYLSPPTMLGEEKDYLQDVFSSNWISSVGPQLTSLESELSRLSSRKYGVALNSATAAIHLGLLELGVSKNDTVLCATFSFVASANPITYLGAKPVFVGIEKDTWNMCPVLLEEAIETEILKGKKPKAIVLVHSYGMPAKVDEILAITNQYNIPVLEDAAAALGSVYKNKPCGSFGKIGVFSFNGNKIITTSAGGVLLTNYENVKESVLKLATQAKEASFGYEHKQVGYNYRMSNVLAGIGLGQLDSLKEFVNKRHYNHNFYKEELLGLDIEILQDTSETKSNHWLTCVLFKTKDIRDSIFNTLEKKHIESRPLWNPLHLQEAFKGTSYYGDKTSEDYFNRGLCLPSGYELTDEQLTRIIDLIKSCL